MVYSPKFFLPHNQNLLRLFVEDICLIIISDFRMIIWDYTEGKRPNFGLSSGKLSYLKRIVKRPAMELGSSQLA
jgi:hypothetical protein